MTPSRAQRLVLLAACAVIALAVSAELILGRSHGAPALALFVGRFHPLVVHLPIGFVLLMGLAEAAMFVPRWRSRIEPALGLLLPVAAVSALAAFLLGQLLSLEGGFPAESLRWHRRLTLFAVIGVALCWLVFDLQRRKAWRHGRTAYRGLLGATLGVLSLGAHFGGTMTRGDAYLSKYAPDLLKPLLGGGEPKQPPKEKKAAVAAAEPLLFTDVVLPILQEHCVECHGPEKAKGSLLLDSLENVLKGGENGAVVVSGLSAQSSLIQRLLLPVTDDDRMPPEGKPGPKPEEVELLRFWIDRGANATLRVRDALAPLTSRALLEKAAAGVVTPKSAGALPGAVASAVPPAPAASVASGDSAASGTPAAAAATTATSTTTSTTNSAPDSAAAGEPAAAAAPEADKPSALVSNGASPGPAALSGRAFLAQHCEKCHGPKKQKGKLRVDSVAALLLGGKNGPALVPGSPEKSSLVQRVRLPLSSEEHMPPKKEPQPSAAELSSLAAWVRAQASSSPAATAATTAPATGAATATDPAAATDPATAAATDPATAAATETKSEPTTVTVSTKEAPKPASTASHAELVASLPPQVALFQDAVQPLLREKCGECHIREKPAGGLNVEQHRQLVEGGFTGPGVVPHNAKKSLVLTRLDLPASDDEHMPPEESPQLTPDEVELVRAWVEQGAPAQASTDTTKLSPGAVRALDARRATLPKGLPPQAGGCAACTLPGASRQGSLGAQLLSLLAGVAVLGLRRKQRSQDRAFTSLSR